MGNATVGFAVIYSWRIRDGRFVAYAQWPDRRHWERSRELGPVDAEAAAVMVDAIEESADPITLVPVLNLLDREVAR